ncbi:DUF6801 domain-containing protein [Streptomyces sp. NRRL F-4489]|uniref:DUF6801 domain-containing protein n=1 Tax=Streptomyces sp. NRRL F-4489 TaxID=1609095 RepID=UPI000B2BEFFA|nr:DUF6801 domain-containing protein [Streptomyces sp. NRRL F-4489]
MRITVAVVAASATASGVLGVIGAGTAAAQPLSRTFSYTCSSLLIGNHPFTAKITADIPNAVAVGTPGKTITVKAVATVGASFTQWLATAGLKTLGGTVDANAHVAAPQDDFDVTVPFRMATTSVPASGPFNVTATGSATTHAFSHPGKGRITAGGLTLHLLGKNATGNLALRGDAPCTLNPGQSNVVASFAITKPGSAGSATPSHSTGSPPSATAPPTTGSMGAAAPRPTTGSMDAAVPPPTTSADTGPATRSATATSGNPNPGASSTPTVRNPSRAAPRPTEAALAGEAPATGQNTRDLVLLAVGVLVACAAAFGLGARLRNRRRPGDDGVDQQHGATQQDIDPRHGLLIDGAEGGRTDAGDDRKSLTPGAPQHRGCGGSAASGGSTRRRTTDGRSHLTKRHVHNHRAAHQAIGARACGGGADPSSLLPGLPQGEDVDVAADEKPGPAYVRQAQ